MGIKNFSLRQIVWWTKREDMALDRFLDEKINVALAPNMAMRYIVSRTLENDKLANEVAAEINAMFEDLQAKKPTVVKCSETCDFSDHPSAINEHRSQCEHYAVLAKGRMDAYLQKLRVEKTVKPEAPIINA